ncbi:MAG: extracellular solute-binding protein [Propioniciclava sp.]|uniref:ABC transporter substrate-binding protein n=1 Tax=Propioniciclava sp. TaxID=2038686 RepID=UPI0039E44998
MASTKRLAMIAASVAAMALPLAACGGTPTQTAATANKTLKVSTFSFGLEAYEESIIKPFEAKTGIDVEVVHGRNAERLNELDATGNAAGVDVMIITDNFAAQGQAKNLFQKVDASKVPSLADVADFAKTADYNGPATTYQLNGVVYDTRKLDAATASDWALFGSPEVKGKVALPDISATAGQLVVSGLGTAYGSGPFDYDTAIGKLVEWKPGVLKFYSTTTEVSNLITQGEIVAADSISTFAATLISSDSNYAFAVPSKGAYMATNRAMIPTGAGNVEGAHQFIDFLMSAEAQEAAAKAYNDLPVNTKVTVPDTLVKALGDVAKDPVAAGYQVLDSEKVASGYSALAERFTREVTGS